MKNLSSVAVSSAIALVFACSASSAQDKPNTAATSKSNESATSATKAAKAPAQEPTRVNSTNTKALTERAGAKQSTPAVNQVAPAERTHESCHGKDSDA